MNYKTYEFGLNLAKIPNFDIYTNTETVDISEEYLSRYSSYLKQIIPNLDKNNITALTIFGGEPFLYFNKIKAFIEDLADYIDWFTIITYGDGVLENWLDILNLWNNLSNNFSIKLEWTDRNNEIFWPIYSRLLGRSLTGSINARISGNNIVKLQELVNTFIDRSNICQGINFGKLHLKLSLNNSYYNNYNRDIAENIIQDTITTIKNNGLANSDKITYYNILSNTSHLNKIYLDCMTGNGDIYLGYETPIMSDYGLNSCKLGHITENYDILLEKRNASNIESQNTVAELDDCYKLFLSVPISEENINDIDIINVSPFDAACELHQLLLKFNN